VWPPCAGEVGSAIMSEPLYAGIDAGGTAFKCIVATGPERVLALEKIPVTDPATTLAACREFFLRARQEHGEFAALGIASFGPVDLHKDSPTFGSITSTPKPQWANTNLVSYFRDALAVPVHFDTDVNGALLAEHRWGASRDLHSAVYVTVGTGIGAGVMVDGHLLHGRMHPEAGHMLVPRYTSDPFSGACPYHGGCLEGLAAGPALQQRWQQSPLTLPDNHPAWELQAHYLALMCVNLTLMYSPQRIVLGGGVMEREVLLPMVRQAYLAQINGYVGDQRAEVENYISAPGLGGRAGALGAIALAQQS
jgi:fructokinase